MSSVIKQKSLTVRSMLILYGALEIQNYKLTKITGTRFVGHRTNALRRLLDMWPAFKMAYENLIASPLNEKMNIE